MFRFIGYTRAFSTSSRVLSSHSQLARNTLRDISKAYESGKPISMVTCYDFITGKMVDKANIDIGLVGDSLAMTTLGFQDTNEVTLDEFMYHVKSVVRGNDSSFLVADLPFGSYEKSVEQAVDTCIQLIKFGKVQAIKLEGGNPEILPTIKKLVSIGIPVMGHVGLTPQRHNTFGGFKLQGNNTASALQVYQECVNLQNAGVFSIVLECIPNKLAEYITKNISVPTIGIGAGPNCSGQVLVMADLLGMCDPETTHKPKFVKTYDNFFERGVAALKKYDSDLVDGTFPLADEHGYKIKRDVFEEFKLKTSEGKN